MNKIATYIRLSVDDIKTDSLSIDGQRKFLNYHIDQLPEYTDTEIIEFVDNGHTGTNFERPAIQELLDLVRENAISCILVKDACAIIGLNRKNPVTTGFFGLVFLF